MTAWQKQTVYFAGGVALVMLIFFITKKNNAALPKIAQGNSGNPVILPANIPTQTFKPASSCGLIEGDFIKGKKEGKAAVIMDEKISYLSAGAEKKLSVAKFMEVDDEKLSDIAKGQEIKEDSNFVKSYLN